jgi:signal transduction histidine kinase
LNRRRWLSPAPVGVLCSASPAFAQSAPVSALDGLLSAAPAVVTVGALLFGLTATVILVRNRQAARAAEAEAKSRLGAMQGHADTLFNVLSGLPEVTIAFVGDGSTPEVYGQASILVPEAGRADAVLDFARWLKAEDASLLNARLSSLRNTGRSFDLNPVALDGRVIRATGRAAGGMVLLQLRPATVSADQSPGTTSAPPGPPDFSAAKLVFDLMLEPCWIRNAVGELVYANAAYSDLAASLGRKDRPAELFSPRFMKDQLARLSQNVAPITFSGTLEDGEPFEAILLRLTGGTGGFMRRRPAIVQPASVEPALDGNLEHIAAAIDTLTTPIAIFDADRRLTQFNRAYCELWRLEPDWLSTNPPETEILDRLRTAGLLPAEADYRAWRDRHMESYQFESPREELWYLPDNRIINVIAAPASAEGGVIYVFEDRTEWLRLESRNKALVEVQRETLNALNEAVAVFGTNGRLTLYNQRLSSLWRLPMNELGQHPHIDQIAEACARAMPEDGATIWRDFKRDIIDLNPTRTDANGRLTRADGRLVDYAVVRLPDGQTLMTFTDVTEGVNYQRMLTERNEALIAADKLKDAFVQHVSYELRSPLTNIIGFADLLATPDTGPLNDRQREYTDYIRSSSATLGVLIDNILDLTTIDAGITELDLAEQDIPSLITKARAGLNATVSPANSDNPLNLVVDLEEDLPHLYADGTRIVQILYNLLANAARFSDPGSEIRLSVRSRGDRILFTVEDEGAGIPEEMRAALFQRFEGHSVEGRQHGAGLGLAIVKTFVNLHGGTISIHSRDPSGTMVTVNLPVNSAQAAGAAE